jgi:hypothetical protein
VVGGSSTFKDWMDRMERMEEPQIESFLSGDDMHH